MKGRRLAALAACLLPWGCDAGIEDVEETPPAVLSAEVVEGPGPIFRTLVVELEREAGAVVDYRADGPPLRVEAGGRRRIHQIPLPRLHAETAYLYEVRAVGAAGDTGTAVTGGFSTGELPTELAALRLDVTGRATADLLLLEPLGSLLPYAPVVVDASGRIVWYSPVKGRGSTGFTVYADSLFATLAPAAGIEVFSPRSHEEVWSLSREEAAARTGIDPFVIHHDVIAGPGGTLLFLARDTTVARDTVWHGEAVWEWDPVTDELIRRWRSGDFLDPATDRGTRSRPDDWLHANSLALGPRGNVLVSLFWLHEVLSIPPGWDGIEWRLGGPAGTFSGVDEAMEAGQHTAAEVAPDRVLLFDNGRGRASGLFSRALELELDRERGTAEVVWEFRPEPDVYAPIISSARRLDNGNTVIGFGVAEGFRATEDEPPASGPVVFYEAGPDGSAVWRMEMTEEVQLVYRVTPLESIGGERVVR